MLRTSVSRFALGVVLGALVILVVPMATIAGKVTFPKTVSVSVVTSACPGDVTVNASWDSKGGPADYAQMYLWQLDPVTGQPATFADRLNVPLATKSSATYTFTGVTSGDYRVNVFVWNNSGKELGTYFGTSDGPSYTCPAV